MLVVGDRELAADSVAVCLRTGENLGSMTVDETVARFTEEGLQSPLSCVY